ncbi:hypothetical protein AB1Y20_003042 [Prymnesium parvum]|uniref:Uncharacterized protein n=1 Tax=Prymnesium parvum TaxID=97485 RepID=A0AB34JCG9_PRYPA
MQAAAEAGAELRPGMIDYKVALDAEMKKINSLPLVNSVVLSLPRASLRSPSARVCDPGIVTCLPIRHVVVVVVVVVIVVVVVVLVVVVVVVVLVAPVDNETGAFLFCTACEEPMTDDAGEVRTGKAVHSCRQ